MKPAGVARRDWTREELLVAFYAYASLPFGQLHKGNPLIATIAASIGRTPSALAMKTANFASLDPVHAARGAAGLVRSSKGDRQLWKEFSENPTRTCEDAVQAFEKLCGEIQNSKPNPPFRNTEVEAVVRTRRGQEFFRKSVLLSYGNCCALSGIAVDSLLIASHIVPWAANETHRLDPRNGIALNALYDKAFDSGLFTFDENLRVRVSSALPANDSFLDIAGRQLRQPTRWRPLPEFLTYHRTHVFKG